MPFWYTLKSYSIASAIATIGLIVLCASASKVGAADYFSADDTAGLELHQDLALPDASTLVEGDIFRKSTSGRRSIGPPNSGLLWIDGIVPYKIDSALAPHSIRAIESAISHWNLVSGITLMPIDEVMEVNGKVADSVLFKKNVGCASWVGRQGGQQDIWIGSNCSTGSIMHEIGHVLGLEHEHTRPDRDQYIEIHWENISADKSHNFDVARAGAEILGEYDYGSIMHYGRFNFSKSGEPTITPLLGELNSIGQRRAPSQGDLNAIAELYAADISVVAHLFTSESGLEAAIHLDNNLAQGAHTIKVHVSIDASSIRSHSVNGWVCTKDSNAELVCSLDRLAGGSTTVLLLDIDPDENLTTFEAVVTSKTPDSEMENNSNWSGMDQIEPVAEPVIAAARLQDDETGATVTGAISAFWLLLTLLLFRRTSF